MSQEDRPPSLLRRALPALTLAGAGGLLLVKLDHPSSGALSTASAVPTPLSAAGTTPSAAAGAAAAPTAAAAAGTVPSTVPEAPATTAASGGSAASGSSGTCSNDVVGPTVNTRWGPVQVEALISGDGRVCDIQAVQSPSSERRSISINQRALPILHDQAMQSAASFDGVTGATVTSEGYRASLQAILDGA